MPYRHPYAPSTADTSSPDQAFDEIFDEVIDLEEWADWEGWEGIMPSTSLMAPNCTAASMASSVISTPDSWSVSETTNPSSFAFEESRSMVFKNPTTMMRIRELQNSTMFTEIEERGLQTIAMPFHIFPTTLQLDIDVDVQESSLATSISSFSPSQSPAPSPEAETSSLVVQQTRKTRKRRSAKDEEVPDALCLSRKQGHNAIEKRYRTNLNDKIDQLRNALPLLSSKTSPGSTSTSSKSSPFPTTITIDNSDSDPEMEENKPTNHPPRCGKAATLTRAEEYIKYLENATLCLGNEASAMQTPIGAFERLAMNGSVMKSINMGNNGEEGGVLVGRKECVTLEEIQADFNLSNTTALTSEVAKLKGGKKKKV